MVLNNRTVMVVEDHDFQRRMTLRLLKDLGAGELLEAANGVEALSLLAGRTEPVDIIFCDLDMPEMDGVEFIRHVAEDQLAQAVAVVSAMEISILNTVETMAKAYGLQVLGAIPKPLNLQDLTACISSFHPKEQVREAVPARSEFDAEDLKQGLKEREFIAYFQPKVSFATGEVQGVEALVRWFRPGHGAVSPLQFIHRMELENLVTPLTEVLLTQTCGYLKAWARRGHLISASVNISMQCLSDVSIADRLHDLVKESDCDPQNIILEVTETEVMVDVAKVLNVLARLRLKGFGLSIDDFGTGIFLPAAAQQRALHGAEDRPVLCQRFPHPAQAPDDHRNEPGPGAQTQAEDRGGRCGNARGMGSAEVPGLPAGPGLFHRPAHAGPPAAGLVAAVAGPRGSLMTVVLNGPQASFGERARQDS
ncbi:MAG: EAL domain-containing response regulator [Holophagaceae bacterium]|nr:EAL domain-containing response regulator [Holophagaceae bacterium]